MFLCISWTFPIIQNLSLDKRLDIKQSGFLNFYFIFTLHIYGTKGAAFSKKEYIYEEAECCTTMTLSIRWQTNLDFKL